MGADAGDFRRIGSTRSFASAAAAAASGTAGEDVSVRVFIRLRPALNESELVRCSVDEPRKFRGSFLRFDVCV
jgi:hypothetical protein